MVAEPEAPATPAAEPEPTPKRRGSRARSKSPPKDPSVPESATPEPAEKPEEKKSPEGPRVPRRATLDARTNELLSLRRTLDARRPIFGRQAANRYERIGRDGAWRRPRGLQSKQRRHYGYRAKIVRVGYRSPARVRGLVPSGFRPVIVRTDDDLGRVDPRVEAAVIARTVGTRRRLALEETAQKLGIRVLNPIVKAESEA
jgi:large subunit ribosomal protein L32e